MIFLIIAAVMFVIGLNLFVYIPGQPQVRACALMSEFLDFDISIVGQICFVINEHFYRDAQYMPTSGHRVVHLQAEVRDGMDP